MTDLATASLPCDLEAAGHFLETATAGLPEGMYLHLFCLPGADAKWFTCHDCEAALKWASEKVAEGRNVYIGAGFCDRDRGPKERTRCKEEPNLAGMVGLIADVDFAGPGKKKNYPPDEEAALALLNERCPLRPTIIVHSGHGLQAWWLFPSPMMFANPADLTAAADLSQRWHTLLRDLAKPHDLDHTQDLARVLRLPGTVNFNDPEAPVRIVSEDGPRHNPDDFRAHLPAEAQGTLREAQDRPAAAPAAGTRRNAPTLEADFPADAHQVLLATHDGYRDTWQGNRPDLRDQSPSSYCLALANLLVDTDWTNEQIAGALYRWRHEQPDRDRNRKPPSWYFDQVETARNKTRPPTAGADRPAPPPAPAPAASPDAAAAFPWDAHEALLRERPEDYGGAWNRTRDDLPTQDDRDRCLALALRERGCPEAQIVAVLKQARQRSGEHLERLADADYYARTLAGDAEPAEPSREELIAGVSKALGVPLERVEFVTGDEAFYILYTSTPAGKPVALQVSPEALASQSRFAAKLLAARQYPNKQKPAAWGNVVNAIRRAAEEIDAGEEATAGGELDAWLHEFFASNTPVELKPGDPIEHPRHPFVRDGSVWFNSSNLKHYLDLHGARIKTTALAQRLQLRGGERKTLAVKRAGKSDTTARFWRLPWPL